jgi:type II secretory pathway pseudopilin PulG
MKIRCSRKSESAMSLVEVVVATAVLAIAVSGIVTSFGYGFHVTELARENQRATQILLENIETIRLYNWTQVNSNGFIPSTFTEVYDPQDPVHPGITYYGSVTQTNFSSATASCSGKITQFIFTLNWTNGLVGIPHTRTLATLVAQDGEQNYVW